MWWRRGGSAQEIRFAWRLPILDYVYPVIPAKAGGDSHQRSWSSSDCIASLMRYRQIARLRGGRFVPLPRPESLFFACPRTRRSVCEQRSGPEGRRAWMPGAKKSNPKKGHLVCGALRASPSEIVRGGRAFRQGVLPWRKGIGIHADSPGGLLAPYHSPHKGPGDQRQCALRTFFEPNAPNTSERERLREVCGYLPLFTACRKLNATFCLPRGCAAQC